MPPKKRKVDENTTKAIAKPLPPTRVTRSRATRQPSMPLHMSTRRSKSTSKGPSARASAQASENVSAESSSPTRSSSIHLAGAEEPTRAAKRTRLAQKEVEKVIQTYSQVIPAEIEIAQIESELDQVETQTTQAEPPVTQIEQPVLPGEHSYPTVPSIEDFGTEVSGRTKRRRTQKDGAEEAEKEGINGEMPQDFEPALKRTRAQTKVVDSDIDGIDSEQAQGTEAPIKKRRAPPVRTGPRKGRGGRGRGKRRSPGFTVPNLEDEPVIIELRARQAELKAAFKAIAIHHAAALEELASRDLQTLSKDKDANKQVHEYEEVMNDLQDILAQRQERIRKEYEYKVKYAISMHEKKRESLQLHHQDNVRHLWEESLSGSMHDFMAYVNCRRQAQDDAATEVDADEMSLPFEHFATHITRGHTRGQKDFEHDASETVRGHKIHDRNPIENPKILRAHLDWPEFIHREEMRKQAGPSFQESQSESREAYESEARNLHALTIAGKTIEAQFPESSVRSTAHQTHQHTETIIRSPARLANDEAEVRESLLMLGHPQFGDARNALAETPNHYQQLSPIAKRARQRSTVTKGKQRSGSVQGQRPLLPAPTAAPYPPESPISPYVYTNPYAPYPPPLPSMSALPTAYPSTLPPLQTTSSYHPLPPPPPSIMNSPYAPMLMNGGTPIYPRPSLPIQPYYSLQGPMMHHAHSSQQPPMMHPALSPQQCNTRPQPPPPPPAARQP